MRRFQSRRGNGRFTGNTMENTLGLHCEVCEACRSLNPWKVGESMPEKCHNCGEPLIPDGVREAWDAENSARAREFGDE